MSILWLASLAFGQSYCDLEWGTTLLVGVEESPPFAMKTEQGWTGISVDLWEKVAEQNHWEFKYIESDFPTLLKDVSECGIDIGIPAITITEERERLMDFSHTYLVEDIAVATNVNQSWFRVGYQVVASLFRPMLVLLTVLFGAGAVYFFCEKEEYRVRHMLDSVYWALTTMVTVGYGDEAPKKVSGRLFAMLWMFVALFIFASINAQVLKAFSEVSWVPEINDISDLRGREVLTVYQTFSENLLMENNIPHRSLKNEQEMIDVFLNQCRDCYLVYDRSILEYLLREHSEINILPNGFYDQHLAFAIRPEFSGTEAINRKVLSNISTNWWKATLFKYKGEKK